MRTAHLPTPRSVAGAVNKQQRRLAPGLLRAGRICWAVQQLQLHTVRERVHLPPGQPADPLVGRFNDIYTDMTLQANMSAE